MFTGIVERVGVVVRSETTPSGRRIEVDAGDWPRHPQTGESIAVNGCCLTLVRAAEGRLAFDAVPQTLARTTLASWAPGTRVNLERSATLGTLVGGHVVQGHVDEQGRVVKVVRDGGEWRLRIEVSAPMSRWIVPRGCIAVDGVSLTVAEVPCAGAAGPPWFEVALIPETLARTTLAERSAGDAVNLEADPMAKLVDEAVRRYFEQRGA